MNSSAANQTQVARRVVVGIDGSRQCVDAALWAGEFAACRGTTLHLLHAFRSAGSPTLLGVRTEEYAARRTEQGEALLEDVRREVLAKFPQLWITGEVAECDPARLLVALSHEAAAVVVGTRGRGGFAGLLLGSVSLRLAAHCHCPAIFVRGTDGADEYGAATAEGDVVLGVEQNEPDTALEFAFRAADGFGTGVRLVHAWEPIALWAGNYLVEPALAEAEAESLLSDALKNASQAFPDVHATTAAVEGDPAAALVEATRGARLLVIGAHRTRSAVSVGVGPVVHALLSHAHCPLAVVPAAALSVPTT